MLTVIVVSDFEASEEKTWKDELQMARALAEQTGEVKFSVVMVENEACQTAVTPAALFEALPDLKMLYAPSDISATLKDFAVAQCDTPLVAVLEADAIPGPDWLARLYQSAVDHGEFAAHSGRTYYGDQTSWRRVLNLLDRSFDDKGRSGETVHVSNNGAIYKTDILKQFPYPQAGSPFLSSRKRNDALRAAGCRFYFERSALMQHAVGGVGFVFDFRRNTGFSDMRKSRNPSIWRAPYLTMLRISAELKGALRVGPQYLRWYDWPLWAGMLAIVRIPEWLGMMAALRGDATLNDTAYR